MTERLTVPDQPTSPAGLERWAVDVRSMLIAASDDDRRVMLADLRRRGLLSVRREYARASRRMVELLGVADRCGLLPPISEEFRLVSYRWLVCGELLDAVNTYDDRKADAKGGAA
jgi:hypothetical protein